VLEGALRVLDAYESWRVPHTPYADLRLLPELIGEVDALFALIVENADWFLVPQFVPRRAGLGSVLMVTNAARELHGELWWEGTGPRAKRKDPFDPDLASERCQALFGDLRLAARKLRDELSGADAPQGDPPPLTRLEKAVLNKIPFRPDGILGKELLAELNRAGVGLDRSVLTSRVIPKLKKWWGVRNRRGVGYYRVKRARR
jgi:hypothetical protein